MSCNGVDGVTWKASVYDEISDLSDDDKSLFFLGALEDKTSDEVISRTALCTEGSEEIEAI